MRALTLLLALLAAEQAFAFDANGFRAGMTLEEGLRVLRSHGADKVIPTQSGGTTIYVANDESIMFCDGHLVQYEYYVDRGIRPFLRLVAHEQLQRGLGISEVSSDQTSLGEFWRIEFRWPLGSDRKIIEYTLRSDGNEQVSVLFEKGPFGPGRSFARGACK
jgi:hypothetical protein